jgi:hypothetical protein
VPQTNVGQNVQVALLSLAEADIVADVCATLACVVVCNAHAKHALCAAGGLEEMVAILMRGHSSLSAACATALQVLETVLHLCTAAAVRMQLASGAGALQKMGAVQCLLEPTLRRFRHKGDQSAQLCHSNCPFQLPSGAID